MNDTRVPTLTMRKSLSVKIPLILAAILILAVLLLTLVTAERIKQQVFDREQQYLELNAGSVEKIIRLQLDSINTILSSYADNPRFLEALETGTARQTIGLLNNARELSNYFEDVMLVDPQGVVLASAGLRNLGLRVDKPETVQAALSQGTLVGDSQAYISGAGSPAVSIAMPLLGSSLEKSGAIVAVFNLERFAIDFLSTLNFGESGFTFLVDSQGVILSHPDRDLILTSAAQWPGMAALFRPESPVQGFAAYKNQNDTDMYLSYYRLNNPNWYSIVTDSEQALSAPADQITIIMIIFGLIAVLLLGGSILLVLRIAILKPIAALQHQISAFSQERAPIQPPESINNEIQLLRQAFSDMGNKILENTKELEEKNSQLESYNNQVRLELTTAQRVQEAVIPRRFPAVRNLSTYGIYKPMEELGGDFYDMIRISRDQVAVLIADVSGHGVPAALITMMAKVSFTTHSVPGATPSEVMRGVNNDLCAVIEDIDHYLTAFYALIDLHQGTVEYANAGHGEIWLFKGDGTHRVLSPTAPFLGKFPELEFATRQELLDDRDRLILYTDGLTEIRNAQGEFFTEDRLIESISNQVELEPKDMAVSLVDEVLSFRGDAPATDDITLLILGITSGSWGKDIDTDVAEHLAYQSPEDLKAAKEQFTKALLEYRDKKFSVCIETLKTIKDSFIHKHERQKVLNLLGHCCLKTGKLQDCKIYWQEALDLVPDSKELKRNLQIVQRELDAQGKGA